VDPVDPDPNPDPEPDRIHTSHYWIRIRETKKHVDLVDPDSDPDPEHWYKRIITQKELHTATKPKKNIAKK
jgi:hypothetical protein